MFFEFGTINYIIPLTPSERYPGEFSFFQGYSWDVIDKYPFFFEICSWPCNMIELIWTKVDIRAARSIGYMRYSVLPIVARDLHMFDPPPQTPFNVVLSDENSRDISESWLRAVEIPCLHVSTHPGETIVGIENFTRKVLWEYKDRVLDHPVIKRSIGNDALATWKNGKPKKWKKTKIDFPETRHNVISPNEYALKSIGCQFRTERPIPPNADDGNRKHIEGAVRAVNKLRQLRTTASNKAEKLFFQQALPDLIISTASVRKECTTKKFSNDLIHRAKNKLAVKEALKHIITPKGYIHAVSTDNAADFFRSPEVGVLFDIRTRELFCQTASLAIKASSQFAGHIRIEPGINAVRGNLKQLAACARDGSKGQARKINRLSQNIVNTLCESVCEEYQTLIRESRNGLKFVSDLPLEWITIDDLPLGLQYETSRIPTTPGNVSTINLLRPRQLSLPINAFDQILVIRGLLKDDYLYSHLENAIQLFQKSSKSDFRPNVIFKDVHSKTELLSVLNDFEGAMAIFDCHGVIENDSDAAKIVLGNELFDPWELKGNVPIPTIVVLCSCDTCAIDGSHATATSGFLLSGAQTVIGTLLPVDGAYAAMLAARLIFRISDFLPVVACKGNYRWSTFITDFFRMLYATEFLHAVEGAKLFKNGEESYRKCGIEANMLINCGHANWFNELKKVVAEETSLSLDSVDEFRRCNWVLPECLRYAQFGNPEFILLCE